MALWIQIIGWSVLAGKNRIDASSWNVWYLILALNICDDRTIVD